MPTIQVAPGASDLLQNVADTLGKARKVIVVTGAGISTNSGIPDFRSEHGLYSLIQAQFDKAEVSGSLRDDDICTNGDDAGRPPKRRRISKIQDPTFASSPPRISSPPITQGSDGPCAPQDSTIEVATTSGTATSAGSTTQTQESVQVHLAPEQREPPQRVTRSRASTMRPTLPRHMTDASSQSSGLEDSIFSTPELSGTSSRTDGSSSPGPADRPTDAKTPVKSRTGALFSSSPLSSPPPILFDPYEESSESAGSGSQCSEDSDSDSEDTQESDLLASQTSQRRLRNMKGRDLFDCNIWSDPLKTSVFYRFATTLRQKVREVEPTTTHHFIARLRDIGKLTRVYTQNIDEIEKKIGLSTDLNVGAGNKRRKSAKQQQLADEKNSDESPPQTQGDDDPGGKDSTQSSQTPESGEGVKQRPSTTPDKGVECVFLHGSLQSLRCFVCAKLCDWDQDERESLTLSGEQPECPHCAGATAARQERGKRALGVGKLRPDIVLYGEEHPQSDLISPIVQHDLSVGPDLLLVLGTSLRVHGLKVMVREFAKSVHQKGGKVVFINFTKPSESIWGDVIDYWIEWDCDAWVDDLKQRKPTLWMSPEAIVEHERLKREALAEKKKETIANKKRESLENKKRESIGEKKRDATGGQRPATIQIPEDAPKPEPRSEQESPALSEVKVPAKPKEPAKNPQAERNDYSCGAYCMSRIADAFYTIRGEQFDFFGFTSRPQQPSAKPMKAPASRKPAVKKLRHSFPAMLPTLRDSASTTGSHRKPAVRTDLFFSPMSKDRYNKARKQLSNSSRPQTPQRISQLSNRSSSTLDELSSFTSEFQLRAPGSIGSSQPTTLQARPASQQAGVPLKLGPSYTPSAAVSAAVKSNPRIRKPTRKARSSMPNTPVPAPMIEHHRPMALPVLGDKENILPPFRVGQEKLSGPRLATMEPALNPSPPNSPLDQGPLASLSPNQRTWGLQHFRHPMMLSGPLIKLPFAVGKEATPSPSDQLEEEAAKALSGMRMCR
ncbi:hypothetical protein JX265_011168 [Neoarthrinium moseri]|uniref:Deacetylase sirtuin-type domain-containing protein n=1 Tax=Neoarthrinium moseri TaxID=1658444 RepID=A0A9P9WCJ2_9PEZI|nr:hypothetical protein JX266_008023 [Neoarthrinium moseri]KAI1857433.1 hypothetical protein JX265_011168 [Neoarthrinium moseri]